MNKLQYKVRNNYSGQFTINIKGIPFQYQIIKTNVYHIKHVPFQYHVKGCQFKINIMADGQKVGIVNVQSDSGINRIKSIRYFVKGNNSLSDFRLDKATQGVRILTTMNLNKVVSKGSNIAHASNLEFELKAKIDDQTTLRNQIHDIRIKLKSIKNNN